MKIIAEQYRLEEMIGSGGFGEVYKAYDIRMDRNVAVKIVEAIGDHEAGILKSLDNYGLPRLYDIINENGKTYMVMEWIDGVDLEKYIEKNGPIAEDKAVMLGIEILDILKYLHSRHPAIVYQDLKPSNIMVKPDGHIKLIDFGTASAMTYSGTKAYTAGTVGYGSPEQRGLTGIHHADEKSDIYSWGAVMYSMLSGRLLNRPPYTMDDIRKVCPQISFGTANVIKKATSGRPSDRYENTDDVKRALDAGTFLDAVYKVLFAFLIALSVIPFALAWYKAYKNGFFSAISTVGGHMKNILTSPHYGMAWQRAVQILKLMGNSVKNAFKDDSGRFLKQFGGLLAAGGWMILMYRSLSVRRVRYVKRSVYLTEKKYPGLWIGALLAGLILGYGICGSLQPVVSYAAEKDSKNSLPVSMVDEYGSRMLVNYDGYMQRKDGEDLEFVIEGDAIEGENLCLFLELKDMESGMSLERSINIR